MPRYIYCISSPQHRCLGVVKIGCTKNPKDRLCTYLTGCPPGMDPCQDLKYDGIWETTASTQDELLDQEELVHDYFLGHRLMRRIPGDSEWFRVTSAEVAQYMKNQSWVIREVPLSEVIPDPPLSRFLQKQYPKNFNFSRSVERRTLELNTLQSPVIKGIRDFLADPTREAGYVTAPCGSGKTRMAVDGLLGTSRVIICCPSEQIQRQWVDTIIDRGVFSHNVIYRIGDKGTTDLSVIQKYMQLATYCIVVINMSSHLLLPVLTANVNVIVLDEAHHMAGKIANSSNGLLEGRTRLLLQKAVELRVKRLSLTFTPRFLKTQQCETEEVPTTSSMSSMSSIILSMDDPNIFGTSIAELHLRDLIERGVLPDYRVWMIRDASKKGAGIQGKAEGILEAWGAREVVRGKEGYILNHLVVFARDHKEVDELARFFQTHTTNTVVISAKGGDVLDDPIRRFQEAKRAIFINCFVLGEGVDIPIADSVAITYPKHSIGQIVQMICRAGRWYIGKPIFHVLLPTLGDEDLSGFEEVLSAMAVHDSHLRDEILVKSAPVQKPGEARPTSLVKGCSANCIMIDTCGANPDEIRECFCHLRRHVFPSRDKHRIQRLCLEKGIDSSVEYAELCKCMPELDKNPCTPTNFYAFLHPHTKRMGAEEFVQGILLPNKITIAHEYEAWCEDQSLPSIQHINDGYFGEKYVSLNVLLDQYSRSAMRRR